MRRLFLTVIALALLPVAASAAVPRAGETVRASCRQGECAWLRILAVAPPRRFPQGTLRTMTARRGSSIDRDNGAPARGRVARIEWQDGTETIHAFCSTRRPAFAFSQDGGLLVHFLDPFDLSGYQYASARLYMLLCHGLADVPSARMMRRLGYRPGTRSEQIEDGDVATLTRF